MKSEREAMRSSSSWVADDALRQPSGTLSVTVTVRDSYVLAFLRHTAAHVGTPGEVVHIHQHLSPGRKTISGLGDGKLRWTLYEKVSSV